jgi:hypothetical protein
LETEDLLASEFKDFERQVLQRDCGHESVVVSSYGIGPLGVKPVQSVITSRRCADCGKDLME